MLQVVVLDHGLYRELDDSLRINYCRLWEAMILQVFVCNCVLVCCVCVCVKEYIAVCTCVCVCA